MSYPEPHYPDDSAPRGRSGGPVMPGKPAEGFSESADGSAESWWDTAPVMPTHEHPHREPAHDWFETGPRAEPDLFSDPTLPVPPAPGFGSASEPFAGWPTPHGVQASSDHFFDPVAPQDYASDGWRQDQSPPPPPHFLPPPDPRAAEAAFWPGTNPEPIAPNPSLQHGPPLPEPGFQPATLHAALPVRNDPGAVVPPSRPFPVRILAAVVIALIAMAGVILFSLNQARTPAAAPAPAVTQLSRTAPAGWSTTYAWSTTLPEITGQVAVGQNAVAFIDSHGSLDVRQADTGQPIFTSAPNTVSSSARPFIAVTQGVPVAGIVDGVNLMLWSLDASSSEARQITLALNARVFQQGGGLMVSTGKEHWVVTSQFTLNPVPLPEDHVALGVTPEGFLLSAPPSGSWSINHPGSDIPTETVRPERSPEGTVGEMQVAWAARGVICAWGNTADPEQRTVGLYDASTGELLASHTLSKNVVQNGLPLTVSPGGEYASAGPMLARLSDGRVSVVDGWSTIMAGQKTLYGTVDGVKMGWDGSNAVALDPRAVVPWGTSERGYAIVLEQVGGSQVRMGGLRPA